MDTTISYDELVDLLRSHLRQASSGLITGITESQHSFQIGFKEGRVVLLTYRILKGMPALDKLVLMKSAKIVEHLGMDPPESQVALDSSTILTRLTMDKSHSKPDAAHEFDPGLPASPQLPEPATQQVYTQTPPAEPLNISSQQIVAIRDAAVHLFGPMGAMVCEDLLTPTNFARYDLRGLLTLIAQDMGASEADTEAFIAEIS